MTDRLILNFFKEADEKMERHFDEEQKDLSKKLLHMGSLVEGLIYKSVQALLNRDDAMAREVVAEDQRIDELELGVDEDCVRLMALHQPTATDLRFLSVTMKINNDLERMGDQAVNIAESAIQANKEAALKPFENIPEMAEAVQKMVRSSLDAFVNRDVTLAREICSSDDVVDRYYHKIFEDLLGLMKVDTENVARGLHLLLVARNLERIADHATNIAEDVIFLVKGKDIRHHHQEA